MSDHSKNGLYDTAWQMAKHIAIQEGNQKGMLLADRHYWLTLAAECVETLRTEVLPKSVKQPAGN